MKWLWVDPDSRCNTQKILFRMCYQYLLSPGSCQNWKVLLVDFCPWNFLLFPSRKETFLVDFFSWESISTAWILYFLFLQSGIFEGIGNSMKNKQYPSIRWKSSDQLHYRLTRKLHIKLANTVKRNYRRLVDTGASIIFFKTPSRCFDMIDKIFWYWWCNSQLQIWQQTIREILSNVMLTF